MCHPISILKTQIRRCIESPDTIKVNMFYLFIAHLPSETGHCGVVFPRVNKSISLQNREVDQLHQACTFIKTENIAVNEIGRIICSHILIHAQ